MKILHIGQMIGGLDIYIRNSIIYNNVEDNEYVIVCGKDDKHQLVIRNGIEVKEYPISVFFCSVGSGKICVLLKSCLIDFTGCWFQTGCDSLP